MKRISLFAGLAVVLAVVARVDVASAQFREDSTVRSSEAVLNEIMAVPLKGIPTSMLADAQGIAIIPKVLKGSFVIGARHGRGVLLVRNEQGQWHAPVFISLTGGNVGWQIGVQSTDVILVFKTRKSVDGILSGKFTLGADAAAAAGPVGRKVGAATDGKLGAEIYTYSRSRGLFAGVSLDGSVISVDQVATGTYYRSAGPGQPVLVPEAALRLTQAVAAYTGTTVPQASPVNPQPALAQKVGVTEANALRGQLAQIAPELYGLLNEQWKGYLALPSQVFTGNEHPPADALGRVLSNFDAVASDARYQALAARPEFQSTYGLLKHYKQALSQSDDALHLPPPPSAKRGP